MDRNSRVTVIVPVFNEEEQLKQGKENGYFNALREWQSQDNEKRKIVFVNDGSEDETEKLIREEGFNVIPSDPKGRNRGKGHALIEGFKHAWHEHNSGIAVTLDADILNLTSDKIHKLVEPLFEEKENKPLMTIGSYQEMHEGMPAISSTVSSGERAIRLSAISGIFRKREREEAVKKISKGFGIESALNSMLKRHEAVNTLFLCARAYRHSSSIQQKEDVRKATRLMGKRSAAASALNALRKIVHELPAEDKKRVLREARITARRYRKERPHLQ